MITTSAVSAEFIQRYVSIGNGGNAAPCRRAERTRINRSEPERQCQYTDRGEHRPSHHDSPQSIDAHADRPGNRRDDRKAVAMAWYRVGTSAMQAARVGTAGSERAVL